MRGDWLGDAILILSEDFIKNTLKPSPRYRVWLYEVHELLNLPCTYFSRDRNTRSDRMIAAAIFSKVDLTHSRFDLYKDEKLKFFDDVIQTTLQETGIPYIPRFTIPDILPLEQQRVYYLKKILRKIASSQSRTIKSLTEELKIEYKAVYNSNPDSFEDLCTVLGYLQQNTEYDSTGQLREILNKNIIDHMGTFFLKHYKTKIRENRDYY
ncbi:hypothetical protein [Vibrio campbellii]|uniref:hypothetical protein n=1 Tax=Vibrio campbellii TaxID=680 RepID=UPI0005F07844|nr:hypothetical protein [Vibrio campbellii]